MPAHPGLLSPSRPNVAAWLLAVSMLVFASLPASGQAATPPPATPLTVAVSTPIFADIVGNVAGERAEVYSVIPSGVDPHTWEATPPDIVRVQESDTFVFMGAYLEPFIEAGAWRRAVQEAGIPQLELAEHVSLIAVDRVIDHGDHVHDLRGGDPHVWLDPVRVLEVVDAVVAHLSAIDPDGAEAYAANGATYRSEVRALDADLEVAFAAIPEDRRKLVVFHDAYTYFGARYDFEIIGVVLKNPQADPSAEDVADLITVIEGADIGVVFKEPQFDAKILEAVADETRVEVGELLTDTFAYDIETYLDLMRFNRDSLVEHLAG